MLLFQCCGGGVMEKVFSNFDVDGQSYYLLANPVRKEKDGIFLTLTNGSSAWRGHISQDDMKSLSEAINMSVDDFTEQTVNAMTQQEMKHFQYDVKDCGLDKVFYWKKVMASGDIKFQLGSVNLTAVDDTNATTQELYKFAIDQIKTLKENIHGLEKENSRLSKERKQALQQLEQCTTAKEDLEIDLYSKFQVIVNDKKAKIRQLQDEILNVNSVDGGRRREQDESNQSTMRNDSDEPEDDDQEEMDTDDELTNVKVQQKSKKQKVEWSRNDSLLLDDDEDEPAAAAASSRRRIRKTAPKKQSESSVILPTKTAKVTPTRTTPSTSKNVPHMRRTGSSRSNQSDPDPDDLFNEL